MALLTQPPASEVGSVKAPDAAKALEKAGDYYGPDLTHKGGHLALTPTYQRHGLGDQLPSSSRPRREDDSVSGSEPSGPPDVSAAFGSSAPPALPPQHKHAAMVDMGGPSSKEVSLIKADVNSRSRMSRNLGAMLSVQTSFRR